MKRVLAGLLLCCLWLGCAEESALSYGAFVRDDGIEFRLYAPKADTVWLVIFSKPEDTSGKEFPMQRDGESDWTVFVPAAGYGTLYGYRLAGDPVGFHSFDPDVIIADPYTQAGVTRNHYRPVNKSLVVDQIFDWEGDTWIALNPRDAVICELHVRDMTAHASSGAKNPGSYIGMIEDDQQGGIAHILGMGYNAVELLPAMDFANVEVPYRDSLATVFNTWNPYARNHWGYMTTFFFAPESYYATDGTAEPGAWLGTDGRAVREFKELVKGFHKAGIAVIMDVVYNHVSEYDYHPLKITDREAFFRLSDAGEYIAVSGCGNDARTENPAMRRLILESVRFWMENYHIDGFRFDLAYLIDRETLQEITTMARAINPDVILIAEPWGGGYDPSGFSDLTWAAWNDQFRNGVKGQNPIDGQGFIFGDWQGDNNAASLRRYVMGSPREFGGQYIDVAHSVNYLESHDDHTMGDFIRMGLGLVTEAEVIADRAAYGMVDGLELAVNRLAALYLFTSQGPVMVTAGQSWARGKIIAATNVPDADVGRIDHNSYNKDNETNWLNWADRERNSGLVNYYRELVRLREELPQLRHAEPDDFQFFDTPGSTVAWMIGETVLVALNGERETPLTIDLPAGSWLVLADGDSGLFDEQNSVSGQLIIPPVSGMVLRLQR